MKAPLIDLIGNVVKGAASEGLIKTKDIPGVIVEVPKREEFGDYSTNIAMLLAPLEERGADEIARELSGRIAGSEMVSKCEVAGKGFINIFLKPDYWKGVLEDVLKKGDSYGDVPIGFGHKVLLEFVSANPTGPLHIGHGRGAAVGDALARLLKATGFDVATEYYINDVGAQMDKLGESLRLRCREKQGEKVEFTDDHYKGEYIKDIAEALIDKHGAEILDEPEKKTCRFFIDFAKDAILDGIEKDIKDFGVSFDQYYSERDLYVSDSVHRNIKDLKDRSYAYEKEGATWLETTEFGDDKDRVLLKADTAPTYLASDIAYHKEKLLRGFETVIDVWGADHHGYKARMKAFFEIMGEDPERLRIVFVQLVNLLRGGEPVQMSTRSGKFVTLREVMDEVGSDACRFFFLMRRSDAHLDFDLELAVKQAPENPVYYVQYCNARIQSIIAFAKEKGIEVALPRAESSGGGAEGDAEGGGFDATLLARLDTKEDTALIKHLGTFEDVVEASVLSMEPHRINFYLQELAGLFHPYYNKNRVVIDDEELSKARLLLCTAVGVVVRKGLWFLGVSAPSKM